MNGYETRGDGIHVEEVLEGLERVILTHSKLPDSTVRKPSDIAAGLTLVVNIWHPSPRFEGASPIRFISEDVKYEIAHLISANFGTVAEQNPAAMQAIVDHYEKEPKAQYRRRDGQDGSQSSIIYFW